MKMKSSTAGFSSIIFAGLFAGILAIVLVSAITAMKFQQKEIGRNMDLLEGFYPAEVAAWNGYEVMRNATGETAAGSSPSNLGNEYHTLAGSLPTEAYNPVDATAKYNLSTTLQFCAEKMLNERFKIGSLTYEVQ